MIQGIPVALYKIAESMPTAHPWSDPEVLLNNNTLFPYYVHFDTEVMYQRAVEALDVDKIVNINCSLGLCLYHHGSIAKYPRFCQVCVEEDKRECGFPYFHREHQIPGVAVCWLHGTILADGCVECGHYPFSDLKVSMPGRCFCKNGIQALRVIDESVPYSAGMLWLAKESAYLLTANRPSISCMRSQLKALVVEKGYSRRTQVLYSAVADALELFFSREFLDWIGYPVWSGSRPSPWVRRFFSSTQRRRASVEYLLLIGILAESVESVETTCTDDNVARGDSTKTGENQSSRQAAGAMSKIPREKLESALATYHYRIRPVAKVLNTTLNRVARAALTYGVRIPLRLTKSSVGMSTLSQIRASISNGMPLAHIMRKHHVGEWFLTRVLLDSPQQYKEYQGKRSSIVLVSHRNTLLNALALDPSITRQEFRLGYPDAYDYLVGHDSKWWNDQIARVVRVWNAPAPRLGERDQQYAKLIARALEEIINFKRPVRVFRARLLKTAGINPSVLKQIDSLPVTREILRRSIESRADYVARKIHWAIAKMAEEKVPISLNTLRRRTGMTQDVLKSARDLVIKEAHRCGAEIEAKSKFAGQAGGPQSVHSK